MNPFALETLLATDAALSPEQIRAQLEALVSDEAFRSSKRSVNFLRYVVEAWLRGEADQIKERTIGIEVFGRSVGYEPNLDHIVRTAATEVRKRLALHYGQAQHQQELRISIPPGSYIPHFVQPVVESAAEGEAAAQPNLAAQPILAGLQIVDSVQEEVPKVAATLRRSGWLWLAAAALGLLLATAGIYAAMRPAPESAFWKPILANHQPVLLAIGDVPNGPPRAQAANAEAPTPVIAQPTAQDVVHYSDAVTMARLYNTLIREGSRVQVRPSSQLSFSDLREGPAVLIGAFNNPWSVRLAQNLRFSLALDAAHQMIYIRDARSPDSRAWNWGTHQPISVVGAAGTPVLHDYALISRVRSPQTGRMVVIVGGLYIYGTQAAGEFLSDPEALKAIARSASMNPGKNLQIVLETTVTDAAPGPPKVVALSEE